MEKKIIPIELKNVSLTIKLAVDSEQEADRLAKLFACIEEMRKAFGDHVLIEKLSALASGTIESMEVEAGTIQQAPLSPPPIYSSGPPPIYQPPQQQASTPIYKIPQPSHDSERAQLLAHVLESPCFNGLPLSQWDPNFVFQKLAFVPWELTERDKQVISRYKDIRGVGSHAPQPITLNEDSIRY